MANPNNYPQYYFDPMLNLEVSANDQELVYENNLLDYDVEEEEPIPIPEDPLQVLMQIEPISTAQRLAAWPEMRMLKPRLARDVSNPYGALPKNEFRGVEPILMREEKKLPKKSPPFQCDQCENCYRSAQVLANHLKLHSRQEFIPLPGFSCPMGDCEIRCDAQTSLIEHVRHHHEQTDLAENTMFFASWNAFEKWKEGMEEASSSRFVRASGKVNLSGKTVRYTCFFSQPYDRPAPRGIRSKTSRKLQKSCTAYMSAHECLGKVTVHSCLKHVGHEKDVHRLPVSVSIKKEIATLLMQGLDEAAIVQMMRISHTPNNRRFYLQHYDVKNVLSKLLKNQFKTHRVVKLMQEEAAQIEIKTELIDPNDEMPETLEVREPLEIQEITDIPPFVEEEVII